MDRDLRTLETVIEHLLLHQTIAVNVGANVSDFRSAIAMEEFMETVKGKNQICYHLILSKIHFHI